MRFSVASSVLAGCTAVQAFSDTSPFIIFSTSPFISTDSSSISQLQTSASILDTVSSLLSSCPTFQYALVSMPNLNAGDIRDGSGSCRMPNLCRAVRGGDGGPHSHFSVAEVVGQVTDTALAKRIHEACRKAKGEAPSMRGYPVMTHLPSPGDQKLRSEVLAENDYELGRILEALGDDYTVLIFSDPNEFKAYEPSFVEPVHMDLKRHQHHPVIIGRGAGNSTDNRGLFEKYQFFTPGIFMSLIALFVMLSILTVGLKALSGLQVSYGAFDKDIGPAAHKKQM